MKSAVPDQEHKPSITSQNVKVFPMRNEMQIRMAYTLPEQTRQAVNDEGYPMYDRDNRPVMERIPNHPTRPARRVILIRGLFLSLTDE
jgi:hypothetical protein